MWFDVRTMAEVRMAFYDRRRHLLAAWIQAWKAAGRWPGPEDRETLAFWAAGIQKCNDAAIALGLEEKDSH